MKRTTFCKFITLTPTQYSIYNIQNLQQAIEVFDRIMECIVIIVTLSETLDIQ